jgi:hypothetical protein
MDSDAPPTVPRDRAHVRRLGIESLLIVLSVLLGFAANQWHESRSERDLAAQALESFRTEVRQNLAVVEAVQPLHLAMAKRLEAAAGQSKPGEAAFDALRAEMPAEGISVPSLSNAAWEAATSTGALRFIGYDRAARVSRTYAVQRSSIGAMGQRVEDRLSDPRNFDPAARQHMLRAQGLLFNELSGLEIYLIAEYRETLRALSAK